MATLTIRNLDDDLKTRLRTRAAQNDHSMEEEVRQILRETLRGSGEGDESVGIGTRIRKRLQDFGGVELELPERKDRPRVPGNLE